MEKTDREGLNSAGAVMFELKPLSTDPVPVALERVERYRLLNESGFVGTA